MVQVADRLHSQSSGHPQVVGPHGTIDSLSPDNTFPFGNPFLPQVPQHFRGAGGGGGGDSAPTTANASPTQAHAVARGSS